MSRCLVLALFAAAGCNSGGSPSADGTKPAGGTKSTGRVEAHHGHGHSHDDHDRGTMKLADAGPYHAALTAHLMDGNELNVRFETMGKQPQPVALPLASFTAKAKRSGDGKEYELVFEPAPAAERPKGEPAGQCSHFVAKAPWLKPDDTLTVTAEVEIKDRVRKVTWAEFVPKKYAHQGD